ncbi:MAG: alpha/beta hydrolase [Candidatus Binatia bacterium]|nr:alpha/beta hydrolase [Candidatus Binatia bacterium]
MSSSTQQRGNSTASVVHVGADRLRILQAGQGAPVTLLPGSGSPFPPPLFSRLAQHCRVIPVELPRISGAGAPAPRAVAVTLTQAAAALGLERYVFISTSTSAPLALWHALDAPERIEALVLIAPVALLPADRVTLGDVTRDPALEQQLGDLTAPTLVLFGTRDEVIPAKTGRLYAERIPHCYYVLVYDAGHAIEADRLDALYTAVRDFIEHREGFVVEHRQTALNP